MIFKSDRGTVWHVVHETATGASNLTWTLCCRKRGTQAFGPGTRKRGGAPTCRYCLALDDVFGLSQAARAALEEFATGEWTSGRLRSNMRGLLELVERDLLTGGQHVLTPRGAALALDFTEAVVPLPDAAGVFHDRAPLSQWPQCRFGESGATLEPFVGVPHYLTHYVKVRAAYEGSVITCIECIVNQH